MNEDMIVDKMFALANLISHYKKCMYDSNFFKINASSSAELSKRQFEILLVLKHMNIKSLSKLAEVLNSSNSNISIIISKLVEHGYVTREFPCQHEDKRKTYFYITPKGEDIVSEITDKIIEDLACFYEELDDKQQMLLKCGVNHLINASTLSKEEFLL